MGNSGARWRVAEGRRQTEGQEGRGVWVLLSPRTLSCSRSLRRSTFCCSLTEGSICWPSPRKKVRCYWVEVWPCSGLWIPLLHSEDALGQPPETLSQSRRYSSLLYRDIRVFQSVWKGRPSHAGNKDRGVFFSGCAIRQDSKCLLQLSAAPLKRTVLCFNPAHPHRVRPKTVLLKLSHNLLVGCGITWSSVNIFKKLG